MTFFLSGQDRVLVPAIRLSTVANKNRNSEKKNRGSGRLQRHLEIKYMPVEPHALLIKVNKSVFQEHEVFPIWEHITFKIKKIFMKPNSFLY